MGRFGVSLVCLASVLVAALGAAPKLPTFVRQPGAHNVRLAEVPQHSVASQQSTNVHTGHHEQPAQLPAEDMPLSFSRLGVVHALSEEVQSAHPAAVAFNDADPWRPNDLHFVTSRSQAWEASRPHKAGGNCHVSRIRAMSTCPKDCNGHGYCGVTAGQRGYKYIPSNIPGECHCGQGWMGKDCSIEKATNVSAVILDSGDARSDSLSTPGSVVRLTVVAPENIQGLQVKQFKIGGKDVVGYVIMPECGNAPCSVWSVGYLVAEEDYGSLTFVLEYRDSHNRTGMIASHDPVVRGNITVTYFGGGAKYWRVRALTICKGGTTNDFAWQISSLRFDHEHTSSDISVLASSENAAECGFLGACSNFTSKLGYRHLFKQDHIAADAEAFKSKMLDYPAHGFGKRILDRNTNKYIGTGDQETCASACIKLANCQAFTYSASKTRPGCFLHSALDEEMKTSLDGQSTYFREVHACPEGTILTCNGICLTDRMCHNASLHHQVPRSSFNSTACTDTMGHGQCTPKQDLWWNCPLHGCNDGGCTKCGKNAFAFGRDLVNGKAVNAFDDYASHYWQAVDNAPGEWIAIAFSKPTVVNSVYVRHPSVRNAPMNAVVEQSNDFINWMPVVVMDDFAALEYAADLPSAQELAQGKPTQLNQISFRSIYEDLEDQLLVELGLGAPGRVSIPTVMFCYYALDDNNTINFDSYATYDEPQAQVAAKFYIPRNSSLKSLPRTESLMPPFASKNCKDVPDWKDYYGDSCKNYEQNSWCTKAGQVGSGWDREWGEIEDYARDGLSAFDQCCACGGGISANSTRPASATPTPSCVDSPTDWKDKAGENCAKYKSAEMCTSDGKEGPGWKTEWGSLDDYASSGVSAVVACCACGGGVKAASPSPPPQREPKTAPVLVNKASESAPVAVQQPAATVQQPAVAVQQPAAAVQQPAAAVQQPAAAVQQPAAAQTQPAQNSPSTPARFASMFTQKLSDSWDEAHAKAASHWELVKNKLNQLKAPAPVSFLEEGKQAVTAADLLNEHLDEFGCDPTQMYSWCPYTMKCVQDFEGGDGGPCLPPPPAIVPPDVPATAFAFHDECRIPGKIKGKLSIVAAYNDFKNDKISEYALYFAKSESGWTKDIVGSRAILVIPKGDGVITGVVPETTIPEGATHLMVVTRNRGMDMKFGITKPLAEQLNIYGPDLGSYHTKTCAIWRRNGPDYHSIQGLTFSPVHNFQRGKNMTIRVGGNLFCSDIEDVASTHVGRGNATVQWVFFHSADGSNTNGHIMPQNDGSHELAKGTFEITNGACVDHPGGVPVRAFAKHYQGGHLALWMKLSWHGANNGEDYALVCDGLTYEIAQGVSVSAVEAERTDDGNTFYCANSCPRAGDDHHLVLQYFPKTTLKGSCDSDEGLICVNEWIHDGCGANPPFLFGFDCDAYRRCYLDAFEAGRCGLTVVDCDAEEAKECIDTWVEEGCPSTATEQCARYEECAIRATLDGRCPDVEVNCTSPLAKKCVDDWVTHTNCTEYPPAGNRSCIPYESCAASAAEAGRCGQAKNLTSCDSEASRACVDAFIRDGCPKDIPTQCQTFKDCIQIAKDAGRCNAEEPTFDFGAPTSKPTPAPTFKPAPEPASDTSAETPTAGAPSTTSSNQPAARANPLGDGAAGQAAEGAAAIANGMGNNVGRVVNAGFDTLGAGINAGSQVMGTATNTLNNGAAAASGAITGVTDSGTEGAARLSAGAGAAAEATGAGVTQAGQSVVGAFSPASRVHNMLLQTQHHDDTRQPGFANLLRHRMHHHVTVKEASQPQLQMHATPAHTVLKRAPTKIGNPQVDAAENQHVLTNEVPPPKLKAEKVVHQVKTVSQPDLHTVATPASDVDWKAANAANRRKWTEHSDSESTLFSKVASAAIETRQHTQQSITPMTTVHATETQADWARRNHDAKLRWASKAK